VHKTQGLTIPHVTLSLDESIFTKGQAYTAMSQTPSWDKLQISSFDISSIKADQHAIKEYKRLQKIYNEKIINYISIISF
jgi:ATP-dependent exoDNAse (exonuclease V) alpha subunit